MTHQFYPQQILTLMFVTSLSCIYSARFRCHFDTI